MERIRNADRRRFTPTLAALATTTAILTGLAPPVAHAQFGGAPASYTFRVVDQNGRPLDGSMVRIEGTTGDMNTPATVDLVAGPQLVTIEPAVLGAMLPDGALRPSGANGLSRNEFLFLNPGGGDVVIVWRTADVAIGVVDQDGAAIAGARWGFAGDGAMYAPGMLTLPLTDESAHVGMGGPSLAGWVFDVRAAFDGAPVDLVRSEAREALDGLTALDFEWRQTACTMGVVDAIGNPIRGATWAMLGHTFGAGDAIALPTTDEALYGNLAGTLTSGFTVHLFTNSSFGSGDVMFEADASGLLSPDFADVNGGAFGLRCGITAFPPLTTGSLAVSVTADGAAFAGAQVSVVDANNASSTQVTGAGGFFELGDMPQGPLALTLAVPAGYHAVDPASASLATSIVAGEMRSVAFAMAADVVEPPPPPPIVNNPESYNYWRREVTSALRGSGRRDENPQDMAAIFPQAIFSGFAQHATDPVRVEGVTQLDPDGTGPKDARGLTLADMDATLDPGGNNALHQAKRELLVVLLNVVSGRLSLNLVVDASGRTLAEEIRRIAVMINDGLPANDAIARTEAEHINSGKAGQRIPVRTVQPHVEDVAEEFGAGTLDAIALATLPAAGSLRIAFTLAEAQRVTLDVYDASGRRQTRLYAGDAPAGTTELTWNAGGRRGVYFARLVSLQGVKTAKLVAAR